jgi:hypothetical protein
MSYPTPWSWRRDELSIEFAIPDLEGKDFSVPSPPFGAWTELSVPSPIQDLSSLLGSALRLDSSSAFATLEVERFLRGRLPRSPKN